jgi:hypothetical protein
MDSTRLCPPIDQPLTCGLCKHFYATALNDERSAREMIAQGHGRCRLQPSYSFTGPDLACPLTPIRWVAK